MRLASYNLRGRPSFGAVVGDGIVDLRGAAQPLRYAARSVSRSGARQAKAAADGVRPDVPLAEVELLPPLTAPEKILCIGINYADRMQDYDFTDRPKYPSMFYRAPNSLVGHGQNLIRPKISDRARLRGRDRHGDRPRMQARRQGRRAWR